MSVTNVRCNVEDHRLFDNSVRVEDITSVDLPDIEHPTTAVKASGMLMDIDMPNMHHYNAMEIAISHNNGNNCNSLITPGVHEIEFRVARQNYNVQAGKIELEVIKVRFKGVHKKTEKGSIETDNPYGSTERYSVLRYEELIRDTPYLVIDSTAGKNIVNGVTYSDDLSNALDD